jgi:hypothetical protein
VLLSGEGAPAAAGAAIVSRMLTVQMEKGEFAIHPKGESAADVFEKQHAEAANRVYGAYVSWLVSRLDRAGSLRAFRREMDEKKNEWKGSGRAAEIAAGLFAGWNLFAEFASMNSASDLVPSRGPIETVLRRVQEDNEVGAKEADPAVRLITLAREAVQGQRAYLDLYRPDLWVGSPYAEQLGLRLEPKTVFDGAGDVGYRWRPAPGAYSMGIVSADGQWVLLKAEALSALKRQNGLSSIPVSQVQQAFKSQVHPQSTPGNRAPAFMGLSSTPRGYVLPASAFDLNLDMDQILKIATT